MELVVSRGQRAKTGLIGTNKGISFALSCRVDLDDEEQTLVDRYKAHEWPLVEFENGAILTIRDLVRGFTQEVGDVTVLLSNEEEVKGACGTFRTLLQVMSTFGGEERFAF